MNQTINFLFQFKKIIFSWFSHFNLLKFIFHLSDFNISCDDLLLEKSVSLCQFSKGVLDFFNLSLFFSDLFFSVFDIFDNSKVMIFCHMDHVIDILNFFIHVDWHGGNYFFNVTGSLLIMIFHLRIFVKNGFRNGFEFYKLRLYLIFLVFKLLIFLFEMLNKWHKILYLKIETHVGIIVGRLIDGGTLWEWAFASLWDSVIAIVFINRRCHYLKKVGNV